MPYNISIKEQQNAELGPELLNLFAMAAYSKDKKNHHINIQDAVDLWLKQNHYLIGTWHVIAKAHDIDGFQGFIAGRSTNDDRLYNDIVVAIRGTDSALDIITSDFEIALKKIPIQYIKALKFYNKFLDVKNKNKHNIAKNANIYITGHSLGGAIAQLIAVKKGVRAITFNAPGMLKQNKNINLDFIINYVNMNDVVGCYQNHIGKTLYYIPSGLINGKFKPHSDCFEKDYTLYKPLSVWNYHNAASVQIFDINYKGLLAETFFELVVSVERLKKSVEIIQDNFGVDGLLERAFEYIEKNHYYYIGTNENEVIKPKNNKRGAIYVNGGNNVVYGAKGNYYFNGGDGFNSYVFKTGNGKCTIYSKYRKKSRLWINEKVVSGGKYCETEAKYKSSDGKITYQWDGIAGSDLYIYYGKKNMIVVKNFKNRDYNIILKKQIL